MSNAYITKYWLKQQFGLYNIGGSNKYKWNTLQQNGVLFPPEYKPHGIPIIYKGEQIVLEPKAEEIATLYAKYIDTEYIKNKIFRRNFFKDFKKILGKKSKIENLDYCDFSLINEHLIKEKEAKLHLSKEEKEADKLKKEKEEMKYKIAIIDGKEQPVGNFRIEPPGIFIGRGCHPKLGKIKTRIYPEDVTLNIGKESQIPEIPSFLSKHHWGKIIHDKTVEWLASWKDNINGKIKYVWLAAHSDIRGKSDMMKFDLARKLKKKIKKIQQINNENLKNDDLLKRQIATALYFIDHLALRVGNEKGIDEADTVGVTSLRVQHIDLLDYNQIKFDFLGKDSVRYLKTIKVDEQVYKNIEDFMRNKEPSDQLFEKINATDINKYLASISKMKHLTAKVFRTYNASILFQKELQKITRKYNKNDISFEKLNEMDKINILLDEFNKANAKVATLCNHQKNISNSFTEQLEKINERIKVLKKKLRNIRKNEKNKDRINKIKIKIKELKVKKESKIEMKNISLGTSKINYIDPRITIAFMKKHNIPVNKIFNKSLQDKFNWAFDVEEDYIF